nr:GntR family transcriptional regulator [Catenuloplanes japonicus]
MTAAGGRATASPTAALSRPSGHRRVTASQGILRALRADIATGRLTPGSRLPTERDLAAFYAVSQPTVREAVRGLEALGLVESRHGSGVYVRENRQDFVSTSVEVLLQMQQAKMTEVFHVRRALGRYSAELACANAPDSLVDAMAGALERIQAAEDVEAASEAAADFQIAFSRCGGNALLTALETVLIRILLRIQLMAYGDREAAWRREYVTEHHDHRLRVVRALRAGDPAAALVAWNDYLTAQYTRFTEDPALADITLNDQAALDALHDLVVSVPLRSD